MKGIRYHLTIMAFLFLSAGEGMAAQSGIQNDSLYSGGIELYEAGRYEESLEAWEAIVASGLEAAVLYYNMGNAAYRSNNIGKSILYFEKALKINPGFRDAAHNLEFVSRYRVDAFDEVPTFFLRTWIQKAIKALPEKAWSLITIALLAISLASLLLYLFSRSTGLKKAGFFSVLFGVILFCLSLSASIRSYRDIVHPHTGIILEPSVVIRSTPSDSGTELFILHEGTSIELKEDLGQWYNIRIVDGREGWIPASAMGII